MRCKPSKMIWLSSTFAQRLTPEPGQYPDHIHGRRRQELLEVGPRQSEIATLAQIKTTHALRQRALHARPQSILLFELGCLLTLACSLYRLMVGLGPHGELPWGVFRRGTHLPGGTDTTSGPVKAEPKHRIARDIVAWRPFDTRMPLGT